MTELAGSNDTSITDGQTGTASKTIYESGVYNVRVWEASNALGTYDLTITGAQADADTDGDGLFDAAEYYHGTKVSGTDTDGDGVSDNEELIQGRDPRIALEYSAGEVSGAVDQAHAVAINLNESMIVEHCGATTWFSVNLVAGHGYTYCVQAVVEPWSDGHCVV